MVYYNINCDLYILLFIHNTDTGSGATNDIRDIGASRRARKRNNIGREMYCRITARILP